MAQDRLQALLLVGDWNGAKTVLHALQKNNAGAEGAQIAESLDWSTPPTEEDTSDCLIIGLDPGKQVRKFVLQRSGGNVDVRNVVDDGHCLYRAFALKVYGTEEYHYIVRAVANCYMKDPANRNYYLEFSVAVRDDLRIKRPHLKIMGSESINHAVDFDRYLDKMMSCPNDVWGDDLSISAACNALDVSIHILQLTELVEDAAIPQRILFHAHEPHTQQSTCVVHLTLRGNHYEALILSPRAMQQQQSIADGDSEMSEYMEPDAITWRNGSQVERLAPSQCESHWIDDGSGNRSRVRLSLSTCGKYKIREKVSWSNGYSGVEVVEELRRWPLIKRVKELLVPRPPPSPPSEVGEQALSTGFVAEGTLDGFTDLAGTERVPAHQQGLSYTEWQHALHDICAESLLTTSLEFLENIMDEFEENVHLETLSEEGGPLSLLYHNFLLIRGESKKISEKYDEENENVVQVVGDEGAGKSETITQIIRLVAKFPVVNQIQLPPELVLHDPVSSGEVFDNSLLPVSDVDKNTFEELEAEKMQDKTWVKMSKRNILPTALSPEDDDSGRCTPFSIHVRFVSNGDGNASGSVVLRMTYYEKHEILKLRQTIVDTITNGYDRDPINGVDIAWAKAAFNITKVSMESLERDTGFIREYCTNEDDVDEEELQFREEGIAWIAENLCIAGRFVPLLGTTQDIEIKNVTAENQPQAWALVWRQLQLRLEHDKSHWGLIKKLEMIVPCEQNSFTILDSPGFGDPNHDLYCQKLLNDHMKAVRFSTMLLCCRYNRGVSPQVGEALKDADVFARFINDPYSFHLTTMYPVDHLASADRGTRFPDHFLDDIMMNEADLLELIELKSKNKLEGVRFCGYLQDIVARTLAASVQEDIDDVDEAKRKADKNAGLARKRVLEKNIEDANTFHKWSIDVKGDALFEQLPSGSVDRRREKYMLASLIKSLHDNHRAIQDKKHKRLLAQLMERCMVPFLELLKLPTKRPSGDGQAEGLKLKDRLVGIKRGINELIFKAVVPTRPSSQRDRVPSIKAPPSIQAPPIVNAQPTADPLELSKDGEIFTSLKRLAEECNKLEEFNKRLDSEHPLTSYFAKYLKSNNYDLRKDMDMHKTLIGETLLPKLVLGPLIENVGNGGVPGGVIGSPLERLIDNMTNNVETEVRKLIASHLESADYADALVQMSLNAGITSIMKQEMQKARNELVDGLALVNELTSQRGLGPPLAAACKIIISRSGGNKTRLKELSQINNAGWRGRKLGVAEEAIENFFKMLIRRVFQIHEGLKKALKDVCKKEIKRATDAYAAPNFANNAGDIYHTLYESFMYAEWSKYFGLQLAAFTRATLECPNAEFPESIQPHLPDIKAMIDNEKDDDQSYAQFLRHLDEKKMACVEGVPFMDYDQITRRGQREQRDDVAGEHQDEMAPAVEIWRCPMCTARLKDLLGGRRNLVVLNLEGVEQRVLLCHPCWQFKTRKLKAGNHEDRTPEMEVKRMRVIKKDQRKLLKKSKMARVEGRAGERGRAGGTGGASGSGGTCVSDAAGAGVGGVRKSRKFSEVDWDTEEAVTVSAAAVGGGSGEAGAKVAKLG
eukprot:CAMPEP_0197596704 /NCGR_PEP_ID=MMETSP1326-20131121/25687_1 /TAXON_ID=1155430 /ORGANISM="Genus nov. species nov., Strain RCC2288" /LENGTH=1576 /DNA_ID=CAMNT_0043163261 /DNA_START=161 /DNA_END=4891 /DNA_ORIENTATION=+